MLFAGLLWALILYISVPWDLFDVNKASAITEMTTGNPLSRAIKLGLMGISAIMIAWRWSMAVRLLKAMNRFFLLFLLLVPLSVLWSIDSSATIARYVTLMSYVMVCFAFALGSWHPHRFQTVLRPILTLLLVASLIFGLLAPDLATEHGEGTLKNAWHGVMGQKNQLGALAGFGAILWLHALVSNQARKLVAIGGVVMSATLLVLSRSSTSLLATVLACMLLLMMLELPAGMRRYVPYLVAVFAGVVIVYAVAMLKLIPGLELVLTPITSITGKDLTFSNRSVIWEIIQEHIKYAPYLGSGYGAYWTGPVPSSASYVFLSRMYFYPTESHNGYLEIMNDLGFVGLFCLLAYLAVYLRQCLRLMRIDRMQAALLLSLFFHQLINNLTETSWLSTAGSLMTTVMTCATVATARSLLENRAPAPARRVVSRRR
jgi:O-antigen ligase